MARMTKRKDGRYQKSITIGRRPDGTYIRKSVYGKTQKELELHVAEMLQEIESGIFVQDAGARFNDVVKLWAAQYYPPEKKRWYDGQVGYMKKHLQPVLGGVKLKDIRKHHLQTIINNMAEKDYSTSTMKKVKQIGVAIMQVAIENKIIRDNPFITVTVPRIKPEERRALTDDEVKLLTDTWQGHRMGPAAMIMLYCGLRRGEMIPLTWDDIDFDRKIITVDKAVANVSNQPIIKGPKSAAGYRDIPMPQLLLDMLKTVDRKSKYVCPNAEGGLMSEIAYRRAWQSYLHYLNLAAGGRDASRSNPKIQAIDHITAHMLRHTYASMLYDAGVDLKSAQRFLGHSDIEVTLKIYVHLSKYKEDASIDALNQHLEEQKIKNLGKKRSKDRHDLER